MNYSILYYPTIEFQPEDYKWLWNASLFSDKIYRIVPPNYELNEPENIKELCSTGEIGVPISPERYAQEASENFYNFMEDNKRNAAALCLDDEEEKEYIKMHSSKMDVKLLRPYFDKIKNEAEDNNWYYTSPNIANFYMTFLANHIAKKNKLSLWTRVQELWTTSTYFLHEGTLQSAFFPGDDYTEPSIEALVSVMLPDVFPQNIFSTSPKELLKFREKRRDERMNFLCALGSFKQKIGDADSADVLKAILNDEKKKLDRALLDYKKSMDILKVVKFGGVLTTAVTIAADALGYCNETSDVLKTVLGSTGVWTNIITGILDKKTKKHWNPYSYLADINSHFSQSVSTINNYNYILWRGIEEFIND